MLGFQNNILKSEQDIVLLPFSLTKDEFEVRFCLNVQKIYTVIEMNSYSSIPGAMSPFVLLIDVNGMPIPVLELSNLVSSPGIEFYPKKDPKSKIKSQPQKRIIICHLLNLYIGIIVDVTKKIMIFSNENVLPPPSIWEKNENFFVSGLIKEGEFYRYLFDIEKYISKIGINIGHVENKKIRKNTLLKGINMLIVEDSSVYQLLMKKAFQKYKVNIDFAKDGKQGLSLLLEKGHTYDIIVSDIEMPNMNGVEMIRLYKEEKKLSRVPVIFHSAISNPKLVEDLSNEGIGKYISKFDEDEIIQFINEYLKETVPMKILEELDNSTDDTII